MTIIQTPSLAFDALCYFDFRKSANISYLTEITLLCTQCLSNEHHFVPSHLLLVAVSTLNAIIKRLPTVVMTLTEEELYSAYVQSLLRLVHVIHQRCRNK